MTKILIADDHGIVRAGIVKIIERDVSLQIVGEAKNANEVLQMVENRKCDLLILDINMPGASGLSVLKRVKVLKPKIKILILSIYPEESFALSAFELGASGYITKESSPQLLVEAIYKIRDGGKYLSRTLGESLVSRINLKASNAIHERLSTRETEVLLYIGEGKTSSEIGNRLGVSISTIATYRSRIMKKMNMKSNANLIHYVVTNELLK